MCYNFSQSFIALSVRSAIFSSNQIFSGRHMSDDEILTIHELSAYLKLNEKTAYRLTANGDIPGFKVGGSWRFRKSEIDRWIKQKEKQHA